MVRAATMTRHQGHPAAPVLGGGGTILLIQPKTQGSVSRHVSAEGEFVHSFNFTDIHTTWTETRAVLGKGETGIVAALEEMRQALPFALQAIDSDNGSEFLNHHLVRYCRAGQIQFTRGRPYEKDDNAHIEQKNWTHVRKLIGWARKASRCGTPGSVTYSGAIESAATRDTDPEPSEFAARVVRETTRRGFEQAPRRVVLGDGAVWIWNLANEQHPGAIQIVDRCHAKQKLNAVAQATGPPRNRARPGPRPARTNWMPAIATPSSRPWACRPPATTRRASAGTTSNATGTG
jgi:hypothetical protein